MTKFTTPALIITDYYDSLISQVDSHAERLLEAYPIDDVLEKYRSYPTPVYERVETHGFDFRVDPYSSEFEYEPTKFVEKKTNTIDYINNVRDDVINEIENARKETMEYYEANRSSIKFDKSVVGADLYVYTQEIERLRTLLFAKKFVFLMELHDFVVVTEYCKKGIYYNCSPFKFHTVVADFYLNDQAIKSIEMLLHTIENHSRPHYIDSWDIFWEYMSYRYICGNLCRSIYGSYITRIKKHNLIKFDKLTTDKRLCKLVLPDHEEYNFTRLKSIDIDLGFERNDDKFRVPQMPNVEFIRLCGYVSIPPDTFGTCEKIRHITLCDFIPKKFKIFYRCTNLEYLDINWPRQNIHGVTTDFDWDIKPFKKLKWLRMSSINFHSVDYMKNYIPNQLVILEFNRITVYSPETFFDVDFPNLTFLRFSIGFFNKKVNMSWFRRLKNIEVLELMMNRPDEIDYEGLELPKLRRIALGECDFTEFRTDWFNRFPNLIALDFSAKSTFPDGFCLNTLFDLKYVKEINFKDCFKNNATLLGERIPPSLIQNFLLKKGKKIKIYT